MTSPGLDAEGPGMFSERGVRTVRFILQRESALNVKRLFSDRVEGRSRSLRELEFRDCERSTHNTRSTTHIPTHKFHTSTRFQAYTSRVERDAFADEDEGWG